MNLETTSSKKNIAISSQEDLMMDDFDFKPITSGLGFHQGKPTDNKPAMNFQAAPVQTVNPIATQTFPKKENVYQNDLSIFYNQQNAATPAPQVEVKEEKVYRLATKGQRILAYTIDLVFVASVLALVLTLMARTISMDLVEVWTEYPNEITPLVVILFAGFYVIYFSIFEKSASSTIGKNIVGIKVVNTENELQSFSALLMRTAIGLLNFVSLGLFSYFDLQNKVTGSKVIRND